MTSYAIDVKTCGVFRVREELMLKSMDKDIPKWLDENTTDSYCFLKSSRINENKQCWIFAFRDKDDALLFKLTWGGEEWES